MSQRRLEDFSIPKETKPKQEVKTENIPLVRAVDRERKQAFSPIAPSDLPASYLVSATYDGRLNKALIKLYEPESGRIYFWSDNTGHQPYCLTNLSQYELEKINRLIHNQGFDHFEVVEKFDPLLDKEVKVTKIVAKDPLAIGGRPTGCIRDIIPEDFPNVSELPVVRENIKVWE